MVDPKQRIVCSTPLNSIWNCDGELDAQNVGELGEEDIKSRLRQGPLQFVVANVGTRLDWIAPEKSFEFWKTEVKRHLVPLNPEGFSVDDFPDGYCYCAQLWRTPNGDEIIVLETHH